MTDLLGRITQLTGEGGPVIPRGFAKLALAEREMDRLAAERDFWIKLFNRLEAAVTHHRKATADLATDADDALYAARAKILSAAHDGPNRDRVKTARPSSEK